MTMEAKQGEQWGSFMMVVAAMLLYILFNLYVIQTVHSKIFTYLQTWPLSVIRVEMMCSAAQTPEEISKCIFWGMGGEERGGISNQSVSSLRYKQCSWDHHCYQFPSPSWSSASIPDAHVMTAQFTENRHLLACVKQRGLWKLQGLYLSAPLGCRVSVFQNVSNSLDSKGQRFLGMIPFIGTTTWLG